LIDTELYNLFEVAESREIKPEQVVELLISNGCQIYVRFIKQMTGEMIFEGFKKVEESTSYRIKPGKIYPLTPDSRIDLISDLNEKKIDSKLKVRINWEESKNKNYGLFIIQVKVNLMSNLVIDYEDSRFLPPLSNIDIRQSAKDKLSPTDFFSDNYFHQLVLRTMKKDGKDWNTVKRNLRRHTLEGEEISIVEVPNFEGEMRPQIQFKKEGTIEPYKVMESTFKKKLTTYRKHLKELPLLSNYR